MRHWREFGSGMLMQCPANLFFHMGQVWFLKVPIDADRSEVGISNCWDQVMFVTQWEPICEDVDALCRFAPLGSIKR